MSRQLLPATPQDQNYFCRINDWRGIATQYNKLAQNFLAAAALVGALYWTKLHIQALALNY